MELGEFNFVSNVKFRSKKQPLFVKSPKGKMLKKVEIGDAKILQFMPEIENLSCEIKSEESNRQLKNSLVQKCSRASLRDNIEVSIGCC
jgi:hypothetical protein